MKSNDTASNTPIPEESIGASVFTGSQTQSSALVDENESAGGETGERVALSPLDQKKKEYYEGQIKKDAAAERFWKFMIYAVPAFLTAIGLIIAIFTGIFSYYLTNVSQPMGSLQTEVDGLKNSDIEIKTDIRELRSELFKNSDRGQTNE